MQAKRYPLLVTLVALLATAAPVWSQDTPQVSPTLDMLNERLAQMGLNVRIVKAEFVGAFNGKAVGHTLVCKDHEMRQIGQYVPRDSRRNADGLNIRYLVDQSDVTPNGAVTSAQAEAAIDRAMANWNAVPCNKAAIVKQVDSGADPDLVDGLIGFGGVGTPFLADIVHAGWVPPAFFDFFLPGTGTSSLAVTFSSILLDAPSGHDINGDHYWDVGMCETYYNNHFSWGINADPPTADVESVALHEAGHGLTMGHFGSIYIQNDGSVQFSPFAVMNAVMFGKNHVLQGSDNGSCCGIWASWPTR